VHVFERWRRVALELEHADVPDPIRAAFAGGRLPEVAGVPRAPGDGAFTGRAVDGR
jgi:hypothetical protein